MFGRQQGDHRRSLSFVPSFEPPLQQSGVEQSEIEQPEVEQSEVERSGDPAQPAGPVGGATLPCRHHVPSRADAPPRRTPHDGRSSSYATGTETSSAARRFAERSLRLILEAVDGRRPVVQLRRVAEPTVVAAVETMVRTGRDERRLGPAVLVSVRGIEAAPGAMEIFGSYDRGSRRFALAARVAARRGEWRVVALRLR